VAADSFNAPVVVPAKIKQLNDGTYKLLDATDLDAGDVNVALTLVEGGSVGPSGIVGEVRVQTGSGAPTHTATAGTLYLDLVGQDLYANVDSGTTWIVTGSGGGVGGITNITVDGEFISVTD